MVEAMRVLKLARDSAVNARTKAINQLRGVLVGADPERRESLAGLGPGTLIRACADLIDLAAESGDAQRAVIYTLRLLANRIVALKTEAYELHKQLGDLAARYAPQLLETARRRTRQCRAPGRRAGAARRSRAGTPAALRSSPGLREAQDGEAEQPAHQEAGDLEQAADC